MRLALVVVGVCVAAHPALADEPWDQGVSAEHQKQAFELFSRGNGHFVDNQCGQALVQYRQALKIWDHPAIRYNMAICVLDLKGSDVEAHTHFVSSTRFGAKPLGIDKFREAQRYIGLLRGRLGELALRSDEAGAEVRVNGRLLLTAPGSRRVLLEPGEIRVTATKPGFVTRTETFSLAPGATKALSLRLWKRAELQRPVAPWIPITAISVGAVAAAVAIPLKVAANGNGDDFDEGLLELCPLGCGEDELSPELRDLRSKARRQDRIANWGFVVGGVAIAAGVTVMLVNSPRRPRDSSAWIPSVRADGFAWSF